MPGGLRPARHRQHVRRGRCSRPAGRSSGAAAPSWRRGRRGSARAERPARCRCRSRRPCLLHGEREVVADDRRGRRRPSCAPRRRTRPPPTRGPCARSRARVSHAGVPTGTVALTRAARRSGSNVTFALAALAGQRHAEAVQRAPAAAGPSSACPTAPRGHHVVAALPSAAGGRGWSGCEVVALVVPLSARFTRDERAQATRQHRPPPRARRSRRTRWMRWGTDSSSSA